MMNLTSETVKSEYLGPLGLLASVIHELGTIEKIDARIPLNEEKGGIVSHGRRVAAMILNGLGIEHYVTEHMFKHFTCSVNATLCTYKSLELAVSSSL